MVAIKIGIDARKRHFHEMLDTFEVCLICDQ
jgi:hypothetical protein